MIRSVTLATVAVALPALLVVACSSSDSTAESAPGTPSSTTVIDGGDDPGETTGGVRIPLGQTKKVQVPADAVLDIKGNPGWNSAALRCTATTGSGQAIDLLPPEPDQQPEQAAHGGTWISFWTVATAPGEITVGCSDPDNQIPYSATSFIRVVPRGIAMTR